MWRFIWHGPEDQMFVFPNWFHFPAAAFPPFSTSKLFRLSRFRLLSSWAAQIAGELRPILNILFILNAYNDSLGVFKAMSLLVFLLLLFVKDIFLPFRAEIPSATNLICLFLFTLQKYVPLFWSLRKHPPLAQLYRRQETSLKRELNRIDSRIPSHSLRLKQQVCNGSVCYSDTIVTFSHYD